MGLDAISIRMDSVGFGNLAPWAIGVIIALDLFLVGSGRPDETAQW